MDFIKIHQLNIMLAFAGICAAMIVMLLFTKAMSTRKKWILILMELSAFLLVFFDRLAYIYSGNLSRTGYVMVRVSNFIVFFITSEIVLAYDLYLVEMIKESGELTNLPRRVNLVGMLSVMGMILAVVAQFTGLYYTFDEYNKYQRAPGFAICYIIPVVAPLILLSVVFKYRAIFRKWIYRSLILFVVAPIGASLIQLFVYGVSLTNLTFVVCAMFMYIFAYLDINDEVEKAHRLEIEFLQDEKKRIRHLFDQTVSSFVNALDARYIHTQGHSQRVANYSRRIAELSGMEDEKCDEVYYAALLHDIGRMWMPDSIVKNYGRLSEEDAEKVRNMPVIGSQILSGIDDFPNLGLGAHYHCERYDGGGYPDGLKGNDIPDEARIVAVADAYDLMATVSDLTPPLPKMVIRERIVKESGGQLDPEYAGIMTQLIDTDETEEIGNIDGINVGIGALWENEFYCGKYREHVTSGIPVTNEYTKISLLSSRDSEKNEGFYVPALILFDSYDGRVHDISKEIDVYRYTEFGEIWFDGHMVSTEARNMEMEIEDKADRDEADTGSSSYEITSVRYKDHILIVIDSESKTVKVTVALPDSSRYSYIGLTGEHCHIRNITVERLDVEAGEDDIKRIAEPVSYIDRIEGDIPNVQIDGNRSDSSEPVLVKDGLRLYFHTRSLPSANLMWHCSYIVLFASDDGKVHGKNYREYALIRIDGESTKMRDISDNITRVEKRDSFAGWDKWLEENKKGFNTEVDFKYNGNKITILTENKGIFMENTTVILDGTQEIYAIITGDQCAVTDIRIR